VLAVRHAPERDDAANRKRPGDAAALRQIGDGSRPLPCRQTRERPLAESDLALRRCEQAGKGPQQCRLTGSVRADDDRQRAWLDLRVDAGKNGPTAEPHL
jgi:hypothetical protein